VFAFLFSIACCIAGAVAQEPSAAPFDRSHRAVSTASAAAQSAFDEGLTLLYAFNPEQARVSFETALQADPKLALAWWGVAQSHGININSDFDAAEQARGSAAIAKAQALEDGASPVERGLIEAVARRFAATGKADAARSAVAYRDAMYLLAARFPADDDVATLAAESELDAHPWAYFTAGKPTQGTASAIELLQRVLARDPRHIGANHFLVHALEESPHPEDALAAARVLFTSHFEPAAEHLTHMPAHIFMRVGDYHDAGLANEVALAAYRVYLAGPHAGHEDYIHHDCRFGVEAFMMAGEFDRAHSMAVACDGAGNGLITLVDLRFGRYDEIAKLPAPDDLAAGLAALHGGNAAEASRKLDQLRKRRDDVGKISAGILGARLAEARGRPDDAIAAMQKAIAISDAAGYSEPPMYWYPVRETLGAVYFRAGRFAEAEQVFRDGLTHDALDPRALFGLAETLDREGRASETAPVRQAFARAWQQAAAPLDMNDL
jgi:tetratricopeptide (TPR) repeat protein